MKLTGALLSFLLVTLMAQPAYAWFDRHQSSTTEFNSAFVTSDTQAGAFTGSNTQIAGVSIEKAGVDDVFSGSRNVLTTGSADATANSTILVNTSFGCNTCNQFSRINRSTETNLAMVKTTAVSQADTGSNVQQSGVTIDKAHVDDVKSWDSNRMTTGAAASTTNSLTLVNVEWNHSMIW